MNTKHFLAIALSCLVSSSFAIGKTGDTQGQPTIVLSEFDKPDFWQFANPKLTEKAKVIVDQNDSDSNACGSRTGGTCVLTKGSDYIKVMANQTRTYSADLSPEKGIPLPQGTTDLTLTLDAVTFHQDTFVPGLVVSYMKNGKREEKKLHHSLPKSDECPVYACPELKTVRLNGLDPDIAYDLVKISFPGKPSDGITNAFYLRSLTASVVPTAPTEYGYLQTPLYSTQENADLTLYTSNLDTQNHGYHAEYMVFPRVKSLSSTSNLARSASALSEHQHCWNRDSAHPYCKPFNGPLGIDNKAYEDWYTELSNYGQYPGIKTDGSSSTPSEEPYWKVDLEKATEVRFIKFRPMHHGTTVTLTGMKDDGDVETLFVSDSNTPNNSDIVVDFTEARANENASGKFKSFTLRYSGKPTHFANKTLYNVGLASFEIYQKATNAGGTYGNLKFPPPYADIENPLTSTAQSVSISTPNARTSIPLSQLTDLRPGSYLVYLKVFKDDQTVYQTEDTLTVLDQKIAVADPFFGMNVEFFEHLQPLERIGVNSIRVFVNWVMLVDNNQWNQDNYGKRDILKWPYYQNLMRDARARGMSVDVVFNSVPRFFADLDGNTYPNRPDYNYRFFPPKDLEQPYQNTAFYDYVYEFTSEFHDIIDSVEIGNEYDMNNCQGWAGWYGAFAGVEYDCSDAAKKDNPEGKPSLRNYMKDKADNSQTTYGNGGSRRGEYMEMLRAGYLAVKQATKDKNLSQDIPVAMMGLTRIHLQDICRMIKYEYPGNDNKTGLDFFDAFNVHSYWGIAAPEKASDSFNTATNSGISEKFCANTNFQVSSGPDTNYSDILSQLVSGAHAYGKPIWVTEFGYDDNFGKWVDGKLVRPSTRREQAVHSARAMLMYKKHQPQGLEKIFNYISKDDPNHNHFFGGMGVTDKDHHGKEYMIAYQQVTTLFSHTTFENEVQLTPGVKMLVFKRNNASDQDPYQKVAFIFKEEKGIQTVTFDTTTMESVSVNDLLNQSSSQQNTPVHLNLNWDNPAIILFGATDTQCPQSNPDCGNGDDTPTPLGADLEFRLNKDLKDANTNNHGTFDMVLANGSNQPAQFYSEIVSVQGEERIVTGLDVNDSTNHVIRSSNGQGVLKAPLKELTMAVWYKSMHDFSSGLPNHQTIVSKFNNYLMRVQASGNKLTVDCRLALEGIWGFASKGPHNYQDRVINDNQWHHLACTYDGTHLKYYHNGELIMNSVIPTKTGEDGTQQPRLIGRTDPWGETSNSQPLVVGGKVDFSGNISEAADAIIDDVLIFNKAVSAEEVQGLYETTPHNGQ